MPCSSRTAFLSNSVRSSQEGGDNEITRPHPRLLVTGYIKISPTGHFTCTHEVAGDAGCSRHDASGLPASCAPPRVQTLPALSCWTKVAKSRAVALSMYTSTSLQSALCGAPETLTVPVPVSDAH